MAEMEGRLRVHAKPTGLTGRSRVATIGGSGQRKKCSAMRRGASLREAQHGQFAIQRLRDPMIPSAVRLQFTPRSPLSILQTARSRICGESSVLGNSDWPLYLLPRPRGIPRRPRPSHGRPKFRPKLGTRIESARNRLAGSSFRALSRSINWWREKTWQRNTLCFPELAGHRYRDQITSKRSRFITLVHASTKSRTNFSCASSAA